MRQGPPRGDSRAQISLKIAVAGIAIDTALDVAPAKWTAPDRALHSPGRDALELVNYSGKRAVVTGCSSGIGKAVAARLREMGAHVHGLDIASGGLGLDRFTAVDLRNPTSIDGAVAVIGGVDALFNCAGVPPGRASSDVMAVNFIGTRYFTETLLDHLESGSIVNVASNGGAGWATRLELLKQFVATGSFNEASDWYASAASSLPATYSFSKEAIIVWTMAASADLIGRGIRMNCTCPGAVQTPMLEEIEQTTPAAAIDIMAKPIGRRSSADEQAAPLLFLNSDAASYLNGVVLPVDGGFLGARTVGKLITLAEVGRR